MSATERADIPLFEAFASAQDEAADDLSGAFPFAASVLDPSSKSFEWPTAPRAAAPVDFAPSFLTAPTKAAAQGDGAAASPPPPAPLATGGLICSQTVDDLVDFSVSGAQSDPAHPDFSFAMPSSLAFRTSVQNSFAAVGVPVSLSFSLFGGIEGGLSGSYGTYSFNYPVTIGVAMARDVADGAVFSVDPSLIGVDDATFAMTGPAATASLSLGFGAKGHLSIGSGGSLLSASPSFSKTTALQTGLAYETGSDPGQSLTVGNPLTFAADDTVSERGALPPLTVSGAGDDFLSADIDLVKLATSLLAGELPGVEALDTTIAFDVGSLSYAVASLPLSAALKLGQNLTLTPGVIQETLTEYLNGVATSNTVAGALGATALQVTAPSTGAGEIDIHATYTDTFQVSSSAGVVGAISLALDGARASGELFGIPFALGPFGHASIFDDATGFIGGPIGGEPVSDDRLSGSTVYKVFYGYGLVAPAHGTATVSDNASLAGALLVDDDGTLIFDTDQAIGADLLFQANGAVVQDDAAQPLALSGDWGNAAASPVAVTLGGVGAFDLSGQIDLVGALEIQSVAVTLASAQNTAATFQVDGGGELLFGRSSSLGALQGAGEVQAFGDASGTLTVGSNDASTTFSGAFLSTGTFNFAKVGTGSLILTGSQLYDGATTVAGGDLIFDDGATPLQGDVAVQSAGVLSLLGTSAALGGLEGAGGVVLNNAAGVALTVGADNESTSYGGVISSLQGVSTLVKVGAGSLTLSGENHYSGATEVDDGALEIASASTTGVSASLASAAIVVATGATLAYAVADQTDDDYLVSAVISGGGQLRLDGPATGIVALGASNSYSGGTEIDSGILDVANAAALGTGPVDVYGGALRAVYGAKTLSETFNLKGTFGLGAFTDLSGAVNLVSDASVTASIGAGDDVWSGAVQLGAYTLSTSDIGPSTDGATWSGHALTLAGAVSGGGGLTQGSSGTLVVSGDDSYSGATAVKAGCLEVLNSSTGSVTGKLGSGAVAIAAGATLAFLNDDTVNDGYVVDNAISGAGALLFEGAGASVTTMDDNSAGFTGETLILTGIVNVQSSDPFGAGVVDMQGGAIRATQFPAYIRNAFEMSGVIGLGAATNLLGGVTLLGDVTVTPSENAGASAWSGAIALGAFTLATGDSGPATEGATWSHASLTLSGAISGAGGITQNSSGGLVLSGANAYTGATTVDEGFLTIESASGLGSGALIVNGATVNFGGGYAFANAISAGGGVTFDVAGGDDVSLTGKVSSMNGADDVLSVAGGGRLTLSGDIEMRRLSVQSGAALEIATKTGDAPSVALQSGATLIVDAGDSANLGALTVSPGATVEFLGVVANSATLSGGALNLLENGAIQYVVQESGYSSVPLLVPIYKGSKVVGTEVLMAPPDPVSILGLQENQSAYAGARPAIADAAANIAANLTWLAQHESLYSTLASTDVPVSVSLSTYSSDKALLDTLANGFVVADTAANILGALSTLNADAHASLAIVSGTGGLTTGQTISAPGFAVGGASTALSVGESFAYLGAFSQGAGATVTVNSGDTLSLKGAASLAGSLGGAGALALSGAASLATSAQITTARWSLTSKANVAVTGAASYSGTFLAAAGAILNVAHGSLTLKGTANISGGVTGAGQLGLGAGATNFLSGASLTVGALALSGTASATVEESLSYAGSYVQASTATLNVLNGDSFTLQGVAKISGLAKGAGSLAFAYASTTLAGGALLNVANWRVSGGQTTFAKNIAYGGSLVANDGAELTLSGDNAGLTLQGESTFAGATFDGAGNVTSAGPNSVTTVSGLTIGGTVRWTNSKTVVETSGDLAVGDASGETAAFANAKSGVFDIIDDSGVQVGASLSSIFANAGLFEKTGGGGVSEVEPDIANSGRIVASSGTLDLQGALSGTGSLQAAEGGILRVDGTVGATQTLLYGAGGGEFALYDLDLVGAQLFHGAVRGWAAGDALSVGTAFGAGTTFSFAENAGHTGGVLSLSRQGATAAITFHGLSGVVTSANFSASLDADGATVFEYRS